MSVPVDLAALADQMDKYSFAYLMTVGDDGRPHSVAVLPALEDGRLWVADAGNRTRANAGQRPAVALVWPPSDIGSYSLIADGQAAVDGDAVVVTPTRAVLHRPAPAPDGAGAGGCGSDCVPLEAAG